MGGIPTLTWVFVLLAGIFSIARLVALAGQPDLASQRQRMLATAGLLGCLLVLVSELGEQDQGSEPGPIVLSICVILVVGLLGCFARIYWLNRQSRSP